MTSLHPLRQWKCLAMCALWWLQSSAAFTPSPPLPATMANTHTHQPKAANCNYLFWLGDNKIPSLLGLLWSDDPNVLTTTLKDLADRCGPSPPLYNNPANNDPRENEQDGAVRAERNRATIAKTGGPLAIVMVLQKHSTNRDILVDAFRLLCVVCDNTPEGKQVVGEVGGIPVIVDAMSRFAATEFQSEALEVLHCLTTHNIDNQKLLAKNVEAIRALQGHDRADELANLVSRYEDSDTDTATGDLLTHAETLKDLWSDDTDKVKHAITFWTESVQKDSSRPFWAGEPDQNSESLLLYQRDFCRILGPTAMVSVMKKHSMAIDIQKLGLLALLTVLSPKWEPMDADQWVQTQVGNAGGIATVVSAMRESPNDVALQESALHVLHNLNCEFCGGIHPLNKRLTVQAGAIPVIVAAMHQFPSFVVVEQTDEQVARGDGVISEPNEVHVQVNHYGCQILEKISQNERGDNDLNDRRELVRHGARAILRKVKEDQQHNDTVQSCARRCLQRLCNLTAETTSNNEVQSDYGLRGKRARSS